ncbi:MauE/DoxX family redox-associated membrane protein [Terrabacter sp. 2RAF25]|uniref:MauE/DoxX family redox-associated membrane protein n=1 Tax=Terrabacter sp. 2RAF25 TaxID=3232998 RepID=UPI003F9B6632
MPDALVVVVPALLAGVLLLSGVGKLGDRDPLTGWRDLGVPEVLQRPALAAAHPYVELLLAAALLLTGGSAHVVAAALVLALMLAYAALVAVALRCPDPVECSCFGARRAAPVTRSTMWRNVWLCLMAVTALAVAVIDDRSPLGATSATGAWWWVLGAAAAVVTTVLVVSERPATEDVPSGTAWAAGEASDDLDYLRTRTPDVPVTLADGTTATLRELSSERALLLLEVSESCGGCVEVIRSIPEWREELPEVDVRVLVTMPPADTSLTSTDEPQSLHDSRFHVSRSFGYGMTPTAVLLGADGLLAGGPVIGDAAIREFVAEIDAELHGALDDASAVHAHEAG